MATRPRHTVPARPLLRVIPGGAASRRSGLVAAGFVLLLAVFAVAGLQAYLGQEGLRMARLEGEVAEAEERYALLREEVARLSSPERLERRAAELGMAPATDRVYLPAPEGLRPPSPSSGRYASKDLIAGVP